MHSIPRVRRFFFAVFAASVVLGVTVAAQAADPLPKCQAAKNKTAGKYSSCRQNAEAKLVTTGDTLKYDASIAKCESKFATSWQNAIDQAANAGATCLDDLLTGLQFKTVVDQHSGNVATALGGGELIDYAQAVACGNGVVDVPEDCDQGDLNGETCVSQGFGAGTLACGAGCVFDTSGCFTGARFVDNLDGTVTDNASGLTWEKKGDLDGVGVACPSAVACPDPHDADNLYTFSFDNPLGPPGTAYTVFLAQLNAGAGFAGHNDWRLPTADELQAIVDYADAASPVVDGAFDSGCTGSCTVTTCSCTNVERHWSSSTTPLDAGTAWFVDFDFGDLGHDSKDTDYAVRAVRP